MQHWVPDRRSFTFSTALARGIRVYAFTGTEEVACRPFYSEHVFCGAYVHPWSL